MPKVDMRKNENIEMGLREATVAYNRIGPVQGYHLTRAAFCLLTQAIQDGKAGVTHDGQLYRTEYGRTGTRDIRVDLEAVLDLCKAYTLLGPEERQALDDLNGDDDRPTTYELPNLEAVGEFLHLASKVAYTEAAEGTLKAAIAAMHEEDLV